MKHKIKKLRISRKTVLKEVIQQIIDKINEIIEVQRKTK